MSEWRVEVWLIERFRPYEHNPRKNDHVVSQMEASIREFGFKVPMLARSDGEVVDGHLRLKAATNLGLKELPVILCDEWTQAQVKAFRLLVNKSVEWADWDVDALNQEFGKLKELNYSPELTGFELREIAGIVDGTWAPPERETQKPVPVQQVPAEGLTDEDEAPESPSQPVTVLGDLWVLGNHRVLCGDSTSVDATSRLFAGTKPELCFTDPPYGINIVKTVSNSKKGVVGGAKPYGAGEGVVVGGGSAGAMYPFGGIKKGVVGGKNIVKPKLYAPIANDGGVETAMEFYNCAVASGVENFIIFGGNYFTAFLAPSPCWVVWDKQNSGNFADVEMAWTSFDRGAKLYSFLWNGLSRQGDRKTELATRVHPTQKPVGLIEKIFADFSASSVYDGFLGSGSTLIACEKTKRTCYGMELSPDYVDVIIKRWQAFTGKQATLDGDGRTFDEIRDHRIIKAA